MASELLKAVSDRKRLLAVIEYERSEGVVAAIRKLQSEGSS
jgi:hypothetical protein